MKEQKLGPGQKIVGFESFEELQEYLENAESQAISSAIPKQWEISWGAYVLRVIDRLVIFGYVWAREDYEYPDELEHEEMSNFPRGYRYGRYYSEVVPEGEIGSAHVSTLWEISKEDFDHARDHGWKLDPELAKRITDEIIANTPLEET